MKNIDGWLIDESSLGKPYLAFEIEGGSRKYIGCFYPRKFQFDTLANLEMGLRIMLETNGLVPKESYKGNHVLIAFSLFTGETRQLLLSQPKVQGDKGIWIVERWMNEDGTVYYEYPDTDIKIEDYYEIMQIKFNNGEDLLLGDPVEVGCDFIINKLNQTFVQKSLVVKNPATAADFMVTPTSQYIGFISDLSTDISGERSFLYFNTVDISRIPDIKKQKELDLISDEHLLYLTDNTEYKLINDNDISIYEAVTKEIFKNYLYDTNYKQMFCVYTKDGFIITIEEKYLL